MTKDQIRDYEYCKGHLANIEAMIAKSPFNRQMHGCGSQDARITFELEAIHLKMYEAIQTAIDTAKLQINKKIESL